MFRNRSVSTHNFAMIPSADIPRASFRRQSAHKTTFDAGLLIPVYVDEVLPGDTFNFKMTAFARMSTPIFPIMDNLHLDSFFFFVPMRLVWDNWQKFMGEQIDPGDSTDFTIPTMIIPVGGWQVNTIGDYFGLPTVGQITTPVTMDGIISVLPFRCYTRIWNEWFRDENLQDSAYSPRDDGPDTLGSYLSNGTDGNGLLRRGKRHDYFTSCLPWPQKGDSVTLPLGTSAPVLSNSQPITLTSSSSTNGGLNVSADSGLGQTGATVADATVIFGNQSGLFADLSAATAATINQLRQSFQIQKLLERDARGGTRYTEIVWSHFKVKSPDARLQRPEYLGGGSTPVAINPISQTSATTVTGGDTPLGTLGGIGTVVTRNHGFTQSFTEHGYVIGLVSVRADLTYQQGLNKMWTRSTRYDFYFPAFAHLGEQAVLTSEIYVKGNPVVDDIVFGYQERWAEYRYKPSMITGYFRSTDTNTIDQWHLAQEFSTQPVLDETFIQETPPMERILAVGAEALGQHFIFDAVFDVITARPMPMYSVPGLIDHF